MPEIKEYGRLYIDLDEGDPTIREIEDELTDSFYNVLNVLGVDWDDKNFTDTPRRCARAWITEFLLQPFTWSIFDEEPFGGAITLVNHEVWTRCPHHLERVRMETSVSYIPSENKVLGLSKLARAADFYAAGCVLQESYTRLLAEGIHENLTPKGVAVHTKAFHNCMCARGVETGGPVLMTVVKGAFYEDHRAREEFFWTVERGYYK